MNKPSIDKDDLFEREFDRFLKDQPLSATPAFSEQIMETIRKDNEYARHRWFFQASTLGGVAASIAILFTVFLFIVPEPEPANQMEAAASEYPDWEQYADIILINEFLDNAEVLLDEETLMTLEILARAN